ncbi:ATP-binding cassette domain-containing protein [Leucobacter triazinivorans]|uniref:ATP-binding cassette domain-containing protein n=1 Tax=Leucobacter triazinivorans TaxID=1784719 RepID=A0A4P6KEJ9_9MICO|nr:ATP-binding cassette domain-containing protein [Leucobacter triazinivorans]QBE48623.1 ATP-binding cassette domain-containing protein [Leucobacter triazinivorans]
MSFWNRATRSPAFVGGAVLFGLILTAAILAPILAPYSPSAQNLTGGLLPPSPEHWLGTDQLGRDVLSRLLFAARTDLRIAILASLAPFVIGVAVGLVSGYFGGAVDWTASRITDTVIAFPFYVIVIAIVFAVGAGESGIILAFALVGWVGYARVLRAMTASLREAGWVQAARGGGLSHARVLLRHLLPNLLPQAVVLLATEIVLIMVAIVTLGYLGLGIQPPTPDWGTMIADAQQFVTTQWWLAAFPGLAVVVTGIALSLLGDGIGDALRVGSAPRAAAGRGRSAAKWESRSAASPHSKRQIATPTSRVRVGSGVAAGEVRVRGLQVAAGAARGAGAGAGGGGADRAGARAGGGRAGSLLVDGLSFSVAPGEALGIVGESGSGKSLTLRALLGMLPAGTRASGGEVAVGGTVGMVFQDPLTALDPLTRVGAQLREAVEAGGASGSQARARARVRELLQQVELPDPDRIARSYPHQLSGGQRQRVVIAMALAGDPAVLLCDEPTTALDVTVQRQVLGLLDEVRRERGLTLVFVSHDLAVVASMCDRVLVMRAGAEVESGPTARVIREPRDAYTVSLLEAVPRLPDPAPALLDSDPALPDSDPAAPDPGPAAADPEPAPALLEARGVEVRYGELAAVAGVSFSVSRGGALGIVGESGSGKTSLARALVGQVAAERGEIRLDEAPLPRRRSRTEARAVQLVPQDPYSSLDPRMTVAQTLGELLRVHRIVPRARTAARIAELLGLVRLDPALARAYPHELSGGQRQRVALARALAVEPRVIVADEPTSALDVSVQASVIELLRALRSEPGVALVVVSHDLAVVHELCDAVLVMRDGRAVETGGPEFFSAPRTRYGRDLLGSVLRLPEIA